MVIGINNVFTTFLVFALLVSGGILTYLSVKKELFTGDLFFIGKLFIGLIVLITFGLFIYLLFKFRILIVTKAKIISFYPFWFKKKEICINKIKKKRLENFQAFKGTVYRRIKITDSKETLEISDLEFENFDKLVRLLDIDENDKNKIDYEQAKGNLSDVISNVYMQSAFLLFLIFNTIWNSGLQILIITFFIVNGILLYAFIKRKIRYRRLIKKNCE